MQDTQAGIRRVAGILLLMAGAWLAAAAAAAAQNLAPEPPERWPRPQLTIASTVETPVRLQQVAVRTEVSGSLAVTEILLTFHNPNRRILEGELHCETGLHVGAGKGSLEIGSSDNPVIKDAFGRPYIPGSSLREG